jgi:hypothetical protein
MVPLGVVAAAFAESGFLGELWFTGPNGKYWVFTTQVSIIPNTFPFPDCSGAGCLGGLV